MRSFLVALAALLWANLADVARAEELFVAADGDDAAAGTEQAPFATLERAEEAAAAGDTVWIRGGMYRFSGSARAIGVAFTKSGTKDKPIKYFAYKDEVPIFDLFELKPQERVTGLDIRANAIHLRGLEVRGVRQIIVGDSWGVRVRGNDNILERLHVHDNQAPGVFITSGASNLVLNCDSHNNYDPLEDGGNGDGFGCHSDGGKNLLRGCRAWANSDDGFDFINAPGTCTVEQSWAFRNGYVPDTNMAAGNGAGFKSGGFGSPPKIPSGGVPRHVVRFNLAFRNRSQGFYANHHPGGLDFFNNTALGNGVNFDMLVEGGTSTHKLHNNLAVQPGGAVMRFTGGEDTDNSWNLPVMVSDADFVSVDEAEALAARAADGSLPAIKLLHLTDNSDLVDRGMDVGLPFTGTSPDLGAFERGADTSTAPADAGMPMSTDAGMPSLPSAGTPAAGSGGVSAPRGAPGVIGQAGRAASAGMRAPVQPSHNAAAGTSSAGQATQGVATAAQPAQSEPAATSGCGCRVADQRAANPALYLLPMAAVLRLRKRLRKRSPDSPKPARVVS
jgi:hypothetical protein